MRGGTRRPKETAIIRLIGPFEGMGGLLGERFQ